MSEIGYEEVGQNLDTAASFFTYEISDEALEAAGGSVDQLLSQSASRGVCCTAPGTCIAHISRSVSTPRQSRGL